MINCTVLEAESLAGVEGIHHGSFTREGGVSSGDYTTLNVGLGSEDDRAAVMENRRRVADHLGARLDGQPFGDVVTTYQVHSAEAVIVDAPFGPSGQPKADALVTNSPGLAIGVLTADCTPVLFVDTKAAIVGAAHAGWRGAASGILQNTVKAMEQIGAHRQNIQAAVGPTIHQEAYEVGPEFKARFLEQARGNARFFAIPEGATRDHFDLPGYCRHQLESLKLGHVEDVGRCTYTDESLFFSYRRKTHRCEADYGRQIAAIVVS